MATLAISLAGAAIGNAAITGTVLGLSGGAIGFSIASILANSLQKLPTIKANVMENLNVQGVDRGAPIPILYGTGRTTGQIIWGQPLKAVVSTEKVGGKGGPSQYAEKVTYLANFAVALGEGPLTGYIKIWLDKNLFYDGAVSDLGTYLSSTSKIDNIRFYPGDESQQADPLIQSYDADTPAYRGVAYLVFEDLDVTQYGNRVPVVSCVCTSEGSASTQYVLNDVIGAGKDPFIPNTFWPIAWQDGILEFHKYTSQFVAFGPNVENYQKMVDERILFTIEDKLILVQKDILDTSQYLGMGGGRVENYTDLFHVSHEIYYNGYWRYAGTWLWSPFGSGNYTIAFDYTYDHLGDFLANTLGNVSYNETGNLVVGTNIMGAGHYSLPGHTMLYGYILAGGMPTINPDYWYDLGDTNTTGINVIDIYNSPEGIFLWGYTGTGVDTPKIYKFDFNLNLIDWWDVPPPPGHSPVLITHYAYSGFVVNGSRAIIGYQNDITAYVLSLDPGNTSTIIKTLIATDFAQPAGYPYTLGAMPYENKALFFYGQFITFGIPSYTSGGASLATIVTDLCSRAQIQPGSIDVTELTDTVPYVKHQGGEARKTLENLMLAYLFDTVESDGKLVFKKRGRASAATILEANLIRHPDTRNAIKSTRQEELTLPSEVIVRYMDIDADYQPNSQRAQRFLTRSTNKLTIDLNIGITGAVARALAEIMQYLAILERTNHELSLPREYVDLDPADVYTQEIDGVSTLVRIEEMEYLPNGVTNIKTVPEDAELLTSYAPADLPNIQKSLLNYLSPTLMIPLDIPMLRDADNSPGQYFAFTGYLSTWPGCGLYKSSDNANFNLVNNQTVKAVVGSCANQLPAGIPDRWDFSFVLNVQLFNGTLAGDTRVNVLNGANAALVGTSGRWELIQFLSATLLADGTYNLSGLIRGRKGTEHAMSSHIAGDYFILLNNNLLWMDSSLSEINQVRYYKAVTIGKAIDAVNAVPLVSTGVNLKPYAPVHIAGSRDGSNNLTITWLRRSRITPTNLRNPSLGEVNESYEVDIINGSGTVVRTIAVTSETAAYTAAEQTTDGLTPGNLVHVKIYQLSADVGRGYDGDATI